jgi:hypothetical protein
MIRSSVHLRPECSLALSPSPRAHMLNLPLSWRCLNNVTAQESTAQHSTHSAGSASIASELNQGLLDTGAAQSRRFTSGTDSRCTDTGWLVIGSLN